MISNEKRLLQELKKTAVDEQVYAVDGAKKTVKICMANSNFYLASKYDPEKEGDKFAQSRYTPSENIVVYGLGYGYHVISLLKMLKPNQTLYVIECNLVLIKLCFENTEIKKHLNNNQIVFFADSKPDNVMNYLRKVLAYKDLSVIIHEPSLRSMPDGHLKDMLENFVIKTRSIEKFGSLSEANSAFNIQQGYENGGRVFKNRFADKPLIIVCAGPSLSQNIAELKNAGDKALIMAVGHIAPYLHNHGVKVDFYIEIEAQNVYGGNFGRIPNETPLFILSTASKGLSAYTGEKYILFEEQSVEAHEKQFAVSAGGSVSTVALSLGLLMGCSPIIFVGQDLSYWTEQTHVDRNRKVIKLKNGKMVEAIGGGTCYTSAKLYACLKWIERYIKKFPGTSFINCTAEGARIDGFLHKSLKDVLDQ